MNAQPHARSDIDGALKAPFWHLRLPGQLEKRFDRDSFDARSEHMWRSGWFALFVFDSFLVADWLMANDVFLESVLIRLGILTPLGAITLLNRHKLYRLVGVDRSPMLNDLIVVASGWAAALSLAVILFKSHSPLSYYYHAGFVVVIIYGNLVQQLSFRYAVLFSVGVLGLHLLGLLLTPSFPLPIAISMLLMVTATVGFTLVANYLVEKATRRRYLLLLRDHQLVQDLADTNLKLQKLSRADVLTGVANRRHFRDYLMQVWERAGIDQTPLSVLMLDVDHFKAYNDRYGHPAGDACLKLIAAALEDKLRNPGDFVARYGGEEFVVVLPNADARVAYQAAERVRSTIESLAIPHEASRISAVVTASVGVATVVPGVPGLNPDKLVSRADRALYDAKRGRRNHVSVFTLAVTAPG
ncbi:MAG: GGDEF domain-containing protein [Rubrivivax sp.]|nr:MAG: GGDEF domain-containing protein [Rubrivivax sp.]